MLLDGYFYKGSKENEEYKNACFTLLNAFRGYQDLIDVPTLTQPEIDGDRKGWYELNDNGKELTSGNVKIAIVSWLTNKDSFTACVCNQNDPDSSRLKRLNSLINHFMSESYGAQYIVFPELSIPAHWFKPIALKLKAIGVNLIAGIEYIESDLDPNKLHNQVWLSFSFKGNDFPIPYIYRQDKQNPAHFEFDELTKLANKSMEPKNKFPNNLPPVIQINGFRFGLLVCSEFTNSELRSHFTGKVDAMIIPEWNQDINTFNALVESSAIDIHSFIVQVNNRLYGDSRIRAPYQESWKRDIVQVRGGVNDYFVVGEVDITALRQFQSNAHPPKKDGKISPFKAFPDSFQDKFDPRRKVLP